MFRIGPSAVVTVVCAIAAGAMVDAHAQTYPARAVRIVVPYPPGGGLDITGRIVSHKLGELLGQNIVIDNRPGAGGILGTDHVVKSPPDGYTLLLAGRGPIAAAPLVNPALPYSPSQDLAPVSTMVTFPYILVVHPSVPARNSKDLIALAKTQPGKLNMASGGAGGGQHIAGELFSLMAGIRMTHIAYKGTGPATNDIMGGHADLAFLDPAVIPHIKAGRLRALGVSGNSRYVALPQVPTIHESGLPNYIASTWYALLAPRETPKNVIARLNGDIGQTLKNADVKQKLLDSGMIATPSSPDELRNHIQQDREMLSRVIKEAHITLN